MATFVLVPGAGHGGWCWDFVSRRLQAAGHLVHAPTLTGVGEKLHLGSNSVTLDTHIEDILSLLWDNDLTDVILIGHSYAGMVITGVADGAPSRIASLVYLDAALPRDGEALIDISPGLARFSDAHEVNGVRLGLWPSVDLVHKLFGIDDPNLAQWALARLTPHPWATFETKLHLASGATIKGIQRVIINCESTLAVRPHAMQHRWLEGDIVKQVNAPHDLMITDPDLVTTMLLEIASS